MLELSNHLNVEAVHELGPDRGTRECRRGIGEEDETTTTTTTTKSKKFVALSPLSLILRYCETKWAIGSN